MRVRNTAVQIVILILAAASIAIVANAFASRTRRLVLPGYYPDARRVPPRVAETVAPPAPVLTTTTAAPTTTIAPVTTTSGAAPASGAEKPVAATTTTVEIKKPAAEAAAAPQKPPTHLTPHPSPLTPTPDISRFTPHPDKPYIEIAYDDVAALHAKGVLFLDARRSSVFEEGHIAGARSFSVWESDIDDKVNALFNERSDPRDQNLPIVIYCSGGACEDSHMLAQKLWGIQFNNVYVYKDGFPDWQKRGGAVRTGANP
jgi:rhodanese-related sulfurtransferase